MLNVNGVPRRVAVPGIIAGATSFKGAVDINGTTDGTVLRVRQNLLVDKQGSFADLQVGASDQDSTAYPSGNKLEIDSDGHLRTDGLLMSRDEAASLVLKSANGTYWRIQAQNGGTLALTSLGPTPP